MANDRIEVGVLYLDVLEAVEVDDFAGGAVVGGGVGGHNVDFLQLGCAAKEFEE